MSAWLTSSAHPPPQWNPEDSPRLSQPFWPAYCISSCPSLSFNSPSRPQCRRLLMPPQSHRRFLPVTWTLQRTSVSSADGDDFGPSCTGHLCCVSSPVCCLCEPPGICTPTRSQCPNPRCSPVQFEEPSSWNRSPPPLSCWRRRQNWWWPSCSPDRSPRSHIREHITEIWCVECKEERREHCTLWSSHAADYHIRHTVAEPHMLRPVCEVVRGPCSQAAVDYRSLQLPPWAVTGGLCWKHWRSPKNMTLTVLPVLSRSLSQVTCAAGRWQHHPHQSTELICTVLHVCFHVCMYIFVVGDLAIFASTKGSPLYILDLRCVKSGLDSQVISQFLSFYEFGFSLKVIWIGHQACFSWSLIFSWWL